MTRKTGLTLVELVAAIAITGLLMAGALTAVGNLARRHRSAEAARAPSSRLAAAEQLLRLDVLHAKRYRKADEALAFETRSALESKQWDLEHIRCQVTYEIREIDGRKWLLRVQDGASGKRLVELVAPDVSSVELKELDAADAAKAADWTEVPDRSAVTLTTAGDGDGVGIGKSPAAHTFIVRRR